jgi:hypothetical protein
MVVLATRPSSRRTEISSQKITTVMLEPIQEVEIHGQRLSVVKRLSMMRIMARRMKAALVLA